VSCPYTVLRLRCSRNVAPVLVAVTVVRCANIPLDIRAVPSPPSLSGAVENGQDCDERNPKPRADLSIANQPDVYGTIVIVPAMFIETARRPRYARLIGTLMSGPNERRLAPRSARARARTVSSSRFEGSQKCPRR